MNRYIFVLLLFLSGIFFNGLSQGAKQVDYAAFFSGKGMRHASVGVCVMDVSTGETLVAYNEHTAFTPASLTKIITAATVLQLYPDTTRWRTRVGYTGYIDYEGVLQGDIVIRGCLDPSLANEYGSRPTEAFLDRVVAAVGKAGICAIAGDVVADASLCSMETSSQWLTEDLGWYYGAGCYGINYKGNSYDLYLRTGAAGTQPYILGTSTQVAPVAYRNHLVVGEKDSSFVSVVPYSTQCLLSGIVPAHRERFVLPCSMTDPPLTLAYDVKQRLQAAHISVAGHAVTDRLLQEKQKPIPAITYLLCDYPSDELLQMVETMLHHSDNLYAEAMLRYVALSQDTVATASTALAIERDIWEKAGLDTEAMQLYDGSGLARKNAVTPYFLASLLSQAYGMHQLGAAFVSAFPEAGREGSVRSFMARQKLPGILRLKSGSMGGVLCYAGYYMNAGTTYAVVLMCNHHTCRNAQLRGLYEQLLRTIF